MSNKRKTLIFVVVWSMLVIWSVVNIVVSYELMNYLEQDYEHNFVSWMGVDYGVGLGSLSFCSRAMGCGVAGLMLALMSLWIFPTYLKVTTQEKEEQP